MPSGTKENRLPTYQLLHVALQDLRQAAFFADHLLTRGWHFEPWEAHWRTYNHQTAYMTAMVVAYCRPFTPSRGWPKFPAKLLRLDAAQKQMHARLLDLRNEVYAHSDVESRKIRPIRFKGYPTAIERLPAMCLPPEEVRQVRQTIGVIVNAIQVKLHELSKSVTKQT